MINARLSLRKSTFLHCNWSGNNIARMDHEISKCDSATLERKLTFQIHITFTDKGLSGRSVQKGTTSSPFLDLQTTSNSNEQVHGLDNDVKSPTGVMFLNCKSVGNQSPLSLCHIWKDLQLLRWYQNVIQASHLGHPIKCHSAAATHFQHLY